MAGVYIPGMEMPKHCSDCKFKHKTYWLDRNVCIADDMREIHVNLNTGRDDKCPLIPAADVMSVNNLTQDGRIFLECYPELINAMAAKLSQKLDTAFLEYFTTEGKSHD